jgi:DNA-binding NarL/FixJ family response regulator
MTMIRTLMVDDSPEFIEAASRFLSIDPNIEVVAKIHHGAEVIEKVNELNPDIVLLDLAMPDLHGLEVLKHIKQQCASAPLVIILTLYDNPEYRAQAITLGASGFIYKSDFGVELLPTIRALMANRPVRDCSP